jgi:hypothetical protein
MSESPNWEPDRHSFIPDSQPMSTADNVALIGLCLAGVAVLKGVEVYNRVMDQIQSSKSSGKTLPSIRQSIVELRGRTARSIERKLGSFFTIE